MESDMEFRNTLPREVDDHPDSGMPRQLRTRADNDPILSRQEADVAGLGRAGAVYGESGREGTYHETSPHALRLCPGCRLGGFRRRRRDAVAASDGQARNGRSAWHR